MGRRSITDVFEITRGVVLVFTDAAWTKNG
jgi:hypothetical protein